MLVILNAADATKKLFFCVKLIYTLNNLDNYTINGYSVNFLADQLEIKSADNELVYREEGILPGIDTLVSNIEGGREILQAALDFETNVIFPRFNRSKKLRDILGDWTKDYDISPDGGIPFVFDEIKYQELLTDYNSRPFEYEVIGGTFSKYFVDRIKNDIGEANVKVINILRNPSICYMVDSKTNDEGEEINHLATITSSFLNNATFKKDSSVSTYKFEDIVQAGHFVFNGVTVDISDKFIPYNEYLTQYDKVTSIPESATTEAELTSFNDYVSNLKTKLVSPTASADLTNIPNNIFTELGYTSLTHSSIVESIQ